MDIPAGDDEADEEFDEGKLGCDGEDISGPVSLELFDLFSLLLVYGEFMLLL